MSLYRKLGSLLALMALCSQGFGLDAIEIQGLGWFGDRQMEERLGFLLGDQQDERAALDAALLEDCAFLLLEQMERQGYLKPTVSGEIFSDGKATSVKWESPYAVQLPVDDQAESARYLIEPGILYYYDSVAVAGLDGLGLEKPQRFFMPGGALFTRKKDLAYTPENFERRKGRIVATLEAMGYADARIASETVEIDDSTGAVELTLRFDPGARYRVGAVRVDAVGGWPEAIEPVAFESGEIFNRAWLREAQVRLRHAAYAAGYPDAEVHHELLERTAPANGEVEQAVRFELESGTRAQLVGLRFEGDAKIKTSVLVRQADLDVGTPLDPTRIDRARRRLMALGIYRQVEQAYDPVGGEAREVVYQLTPGVRKELQLLGGWGSYEQARAGFRWTHRNPWGRAHRYTIRAKQSFRATQLQSSYHLPQLFGTDFAGYVEAEYSTREEISYDRSRQGVSYGASSMLGRSGWRMALDYSWFVEEAEGVQTGGLSAETDALVASLGLNLTLDRRDDPLAPTSGYDLFVSLKTANRVLGGNVDFQKLQIGGSFHQALRESTILHLGLRSGFLLGAEEDLPFGERFFSGGENTVRGYKEGEASPLNRFGEPVGAEAFWRGNLELEERVFSEFSVVGFVDVVGASRDGGFSGGQEILPSVGIGLRYHTVVGPVRLEYGHNLDPRQSDRAGQLHFSIGYPF
ncbi:MAG: outer membrane protein assembly factor [Opitutales bacterium]